MSIDAFVVMSPFACLGVCRSFSQEAVMQEAAAAAAQASIARQPAAAYAALAAAGVAADSLADQLAVLGISGAATTSMGLIALPSMLKRGYSKKIAIGCISAGGSLGILIPPSVLMIILALTSRVSVGQMFIAGILPGLMLSALFVAYILIRSYIQKDIGPAVPDIRCEP